jgi:hypothetical protein
MFFGMRAVFLLISKKNINWIDKNYSIYYSFIFLFFVGNFQFIWNFFSPAKFTKYAFVVFFITALYLNLKNIPNWKNIRFFIICNSLIISTLGISTYSLQLHYDTGIYHLGHQSWILENKIVFGLNNINYFYSWAGLNEYILSAFYKFNDYTYLHYPELVAFSTLFAFTLNKLINSKSLYDSIFVQNIILFSFLDNFGYGGGGNGFFAILMIGKPSILYGVCSFFLIYNFFDMLTKNKFENSDLIILIFLFTFLIQLRIIGIFLFPLLLIYIYNFTKFRNLNVLTLYKFFIPASILGLLWLIKNILITGCLVFPINLTCFDTLSWFDQENVDHVNSINANWPLKYTLGQNINTWFSFFIQNEKHFQIFFNFFLSLFLIYFINKLLYRKAALFNIKGKANKLILILFFIWSILFWMYAGSIYRYGFSIWLAIASFLIIPSNETETRYIKQNSINKVFMTILIFSILMTPRISSYGGFIENPLSLPSITEPIKKNSSGYFYPDDNLCWSNLQCVLNNKEQLIKSGKILLWNTIEINK